ncbi:hypothetical protein [Secundilactobacillus silagei]|uniref:hypothetical protein n=1 Tax=Secundilactobacillus silagei TaxID=1293415 RepID=UPI000A43096B|nr:hypothetical protein [Secundilactobacillus silagei]
MQNQNPKHSAPKQHSKLRRGIVWTIVALVAVIGIGGAYAIYQTKANIDQTYSAAHGANRAKVSNSKPVSILLMGTDTGALGRTDKGRTDTIMVVTINPKTKKSHHGQHSS